MRLSRQDGGEGAPAAKKQRGDDDGAAAAVRTFLRNFAALPLDARPEEGAAQAQVMTEALNISPQTSNNNELDKNK